MNATIRALNDDGARRDAIRLHDRSMLVEAGAGSGKTAIMAGRIAFMMAEGVSPGQIAAVTFTELASSELILRVREFVSDLSRGKIPPELRIALPEGLSEAQRDNLVAATSVIDEITCTTIHGFCQRLIKPYPAEADIDPGAKIVDRSQADLVFREIIDDWLRERLYDETDGILAEMVLDNPSVTVALIHKIAEILRRCPGIAAPAASQTVGLAASFLQSTEAFISLIDRSPAEEPETANISRRFGEMAETLTAGPGLDSASGLIRFLALRPNPELCTTAGEFSAYRKKTKWVAAARRAGLSQTDGERLNITAEACYKKCCETWNALKESAASEALALLIDEAGYVVERYRDYKRGSALLDFDDLIFAARNLLRDHDAIRQALGRRFIHVLVDEFQDTDPLQTEIFWRLCGDPPAEGDTHDWREFHIRSGALFLVGDPKQAIYRFRGADVGAYVIARETLQAQGPASLLTISTNFRSAASILSFVNERFEAVLSRDGQPGFTALDAFHDDRSSVCVAALEIAVADEKGQASAEQRRDAEAEAVADLCTLLIGGRMVADKRTGEERPCQPGDIALLAPTGSELWRYEEALEKRGIPVATQAGKGLFRRQEVQDLIALTRTLADRRDTLALGALLRGPLVGLTEEELLDVVWALPRADDTPDRIPRLDLGVDAAAIRHPLARETLERLQALYRRANSTTPHDLLSRAVETMRVRPILLERHCGQAERALANVDLYLSLSRPYSLRGLRAFAEAMTIAWRDEERAIEGRPDAQEEAVALFTMHAAKGLEWPVVVPINTMTTIKAPDSAVVDRQKNILYCPVLGSAPSGYDEARQAEKDELGRERERLWYVATTRARELLVIPRVDAKLQASTWINLVDLALADVPVIDFAELSKEIVSRSQPAINPQTREIFSSEALTIVASQSKLVWRQPSREDNGDSLISDATAISFWAAGETVPGTNDKGETRTKGGRVRGNILHKLMEEVLTGEIDDNIQALTRRAYELILMLGQTPSLTPTDGLSPEEMAGCVVRTLSLPEIVELRPKLVPEIAVYGVKKENCDEVATAGVVDAMTLDDDGRPSVIIDWKSDVDPQLNTIDHYRAQVCDYLRLTGARRGLIVLLTRATLIDVSAD